MCQMPALGEHVTGLISGGGKRKAFCISLWQRLQQPLWLSSIVVNSPMPALGNMPRFQKGGKGKTFFTCRTVPLGNIETVVQYFGPLGFPVFVFWRLKLVMVTHSLSHRRILSLKEAHLVFPGVDPGFWSWGPCKVLTLRGDPEPKICSK